LTNDFDTAFKDIKAYIDKMKRSSEPFAFLTFQKLSCLLPLFIQRPFNDFLITKATAVVSNAPGPRIRTCIAGAKMQQAIGFPPFLGELGVGISTNSVMETVVISISADRAVVPDTSVIIKLFEKHFDKFIDN